MRSLTRPYNASLYLLGRRGYLIPATSISTPGSGEKYLREQATYSPNVALLGGKLVHLRLASWCVEHAVRVALSVRHDNFRVRIVWRVGEAYASNDKATNAGQAT